MSVESYRADPPTAVTDRLTRREREVLIDLTRGYSAVEIAARQHLALTTIRSQIQAVLHKLGVHSQIAAVAIAPIELDAS